MREAIKVLIPLQADSKHSQDYEEEITIYIKKWARSPVVQIPTKQPSIIYIRDDISEYSQALDRTEALPSLEAKAMVVVLEDMFCHLDLVKRSLNVVMNGPPILHEYKMLSERFGDLCFKPDLLPKTNLEKMQKDVQLVDGILKSAVLEMAEDGLFKGLMKSIFTLTLEQADEDSFLELYLSNKKKLRRMEKQVVTDRVKHNKRIVEDSEMLFALKNRVDMLIETGELEYTYVDSWEETRAYQNHKKHTDLRDQTESSMENYGVQTEYEYRIHAEIETYLEAERQHYLDEIQTWMERYEEEIERKDEEILEMKLKREIQDEKFELMTNTYKLRQQEIADYLKVRKIRQDEEKLQARRIWAAEKIQAWWRGIMVRRKLGKYKKKRGKGKGKGRKGKKGGKKKKQI